MTHPYFDELTRRLRDRGLPEKEVTRTVADLAAFAAESGTDPEQEFGTPDEPRSLESTTSWSIVT